MPSATTDPLGFRSLLTGLPLAAWRQLRFGGWRMLLLYGILQGIVALICAPILRWLFGEALAAAGLHSVDMATIGGLFGTPLSLGLLAAILAFALCVVSLQLMVLVLSTRRVRLGEAITVRTVAGDTARVLKKLFRPGSLALLWYLFLVLPLAQFGFLSVLTHAIAIPSFVSGELVKTVPGMIGYLAFLVVAGIINVRLALTIPLFALGNVGGLRAMRVSWRMTKRPDLPLQLAFLLVLVTSGVAFAGLVALSMLPTALTDLVAADLSPGVAAVSLALAQLGGLLLVGASVVGFAAVLVELLARARGLLPADVELLDLGSVPASALEKKGSPGRRRAGLAALGSLLVATVVLSMVNVPIMTAMSLHPQTLVLGHRGFSGGGVENTISGLDAARAARADLVEMDVMQTADGGLVAMHDANLSRLAGMSVTVAELTLDEITQITVSDLQGNSDTIPSFRDYALHAQQIGMPLLVEIKLHGQEKPGFVEDVVAELESIDALEANIYHSLSKPSIEQLKRLRPGLYTGYTMAFAGVAAPDTIADFIVVEEWSYNTELRDSATAAGLGMYVWTVNDELRQRQMLRDGVHGIITDAPDLAVGSRDGMHRESGLAATLFDALMRFVVVV
ncbi:glycerophosphoryl diester phosphodiesterase membrane domain-containing protein [Microterricola viridarii]|uniref:Glycerophosphoryl diester phosphodiesterase n=1 Tax=Microterricola viridarii TaxID=412690 RepID=A0A1H1YCZ2_9MICO|nr:glycerophosphoryl diester phosphodiesterase membrane domain-containing protein [Microterricola viridarii]SDT19320.1 glycerophosphoryl diester phosphodiesterase [Microterricola viridarii]